MNINKKGQLASFIFILSLLISCQSKHSLNSSLSLNKPSGDKQLTLDNIYQKRQFRSDSIGIIRWLEDGSGYTILEDSSVKKEDKDGKTISIGKDVVIYDPDSLARKVLISAQQLIPQGTDKPLTIDNYIWSGDRKKLLIYTNSKKVWRSKSRGDYWLLDIKKDQLTQLGKTVAKPSSLMFAKFSPDNKKVAYVHENNIYVENLLTSKITQLTNDAKDGVINGLFDWVYEEEFLIRDGFRWSPNSQKIAYWQLDTKGSKDFIIINNTDNLYPTLTKFPYPKVGEVNALANIGVVDLATAKTRWMKLPENNRNMYIPRMNWSGNSEQILIQHVNRKQNHNYLYLANAKSGKTKKIMTESEETFLDFFDDARWIENGKSFIWQSERSGWRHLYKISRDGKSIVNLTAGEFDVIKIKTVDEVGGWLYFIASPDNPSQAYLYRSKLDGSLNNQRITPEKNKGFNQYQMSANGEWAIHSHSSFDQPTQKYLIKVEEHKIQHVMMNNQKLIDKLATLDKAETEFFQVKARDGLVLDGYIMRPANFTQSKKYPIIFYVYGEPWGQTVQDKWGGSRYLWNQLLTQQGYIVASIDNRGTRAPKGRDWRKSIYGAVGVLSSRDQSDALKEMAKRWSYIDTQRVGIWGHSGGGSMTLNMLFRYPEQYHVGISLAPVPDQLLYDTIYQERYSGLLPEYADGYKQGSPITHAKNLKGQLLLIHGTGDDNVHYQGAERLINKLISLNKQFEMMSYPNRSHGLYEGKGTTLHMKTMMTNFFNKHLK
ncbi:S9 family peptidase [Aliikangiella sp. IMCC44359]|uniref:S9 family peptidase n=1 Tax=Aliikangiella sp. IMCC44359 TaxID=3459125 RepID=UPI00403AC346